MTALNTKRSDAPGAPLALTFPDALVDAIAERVVALLDERDALGQAPASPWLTTAEAADYLRASRQRVHDLSSQGRLPVHRDGARCLYRRDELDRYLDGEAG